jgi:hypothetical protein
MTDRKVFGIRCDAGAQRAPSEWLWVCCNGEPMLWSSLEAAQKACDQVAESLGHRVRNVTWTAALYGFERQ